MTASAAAADTIIVAGGGPVGLCLAALLAADNESAVEVHVVDAGPRARPAGDTVDLRVYALSRASQRVLESIGAWAHIEAQRASPYRRMQVWHGDDLAHALSLEFDAAEIGEPDLGHIVEDGLIRAVICDVLERASNVTLSYETCITNARTSARGAELELADGRRLRGDLLVAADGADSRVRSLLEMPVIGWNYAQKAIVAHVETESLHAETARQRFLPGGPLAFLPLADGRSSVVWSLPGEAADRLRGATEAQFNAELEQASAGMLGRLRAASERAAFPLRALHALRYSAHRVALVGDAAHAVHPLAGQGMNLGLLDAVALADVVQGARRAGDAFADARVLRRYERRRKGHNVETMLLLDALNRIFRMPAGAARLGGLGLAGVDLAPPARRLLMRRALGLDQLERREFAQR